MVVRVVFRMGSYLLVLYLISKLFYIVNVVSQLFLLNKVLGMTYSTFGIDMIKYVLYFVDTCSFVPILLLGPIIYGPIIYCLFCTVCVGQFFWRGKGSSIVSHNNQA